MFKKQSDTILYRGTSPPHKRRPAAKRPGKRAFAGSSPRKPSSRQIGIWDIDVNAGFLFRVLDVLNHCQKLFKFKRIEATVPMGLTLAGARTREIVKSYGRDDQDPDIANNTYAPDILKVAQPIAKSLDTDLLVCVVAPMIMDLLTKAEDGQDGIGWNFFSTSYRDVAVVSAYDLRIYAAEAKRPFEATLAGVVLGAVLAAVFRDVSFHDETRGCILDYCEDRSDIVQMFRKFGLCDETRAQIPKAAQPQVLKMLDALREYRR
jgi:hypothetical protein